MTMRTCPACSRRWAQVLDPDCPLCDGMGVLFLGRAVLHKHSATVASRAVEFALEATARAALVQVHGTPAKAVAALRDTMAKLRTAGVLADTRQLGPTVPDPQGIPPAELRHQAIDILQGLDIPEYEPGDYARLQEPPLMFDPDERPMAEGGFPGMSATGRICYLARATDPADPLTMSTRTLHQQRTVDDWNARATAIAAAEAADKKTRSAR